MGNQSEIGTEQSIQNCPCLCHESGQTCSMCASMEGYRGSTTNTMEMTITVGRQAFFKAHVEFMAEKLRKRMEAQWGETAEKGADAIFEAMGKQWMSMMMQEATEKELRDKLSTIFGEMQKSSAR